MNVIIIGITGQTAAYVAKELSARGLDVFGTTRDRARADIKNLAKVGFDLPKTKLFSLDPADPRQVFSLPASNNTII